jgi:glycosyltransferase involved in cell wall biosynthesis
MKLSFITSELGLSGGIQVVAEFASRLARRGHDTCIVSSKNSIAPAIAPLLEGVRVVETSWEWKEVLKNRWNQAAFCKQLAGRVPASDWVVATHTPTVVPALLATRWVWRKGRPAWLLADYPEMFSDRTIERWLLKHSPAFFQRILVLSRSLREDVWEQSRIESEVIGVGLIDEKYIFSQPKRPLEERPFKIMTVTDNRPRKGWREFREALKILGPQLKDWTVAVVSKEPMAIARDDYPVELHILPDRRQLIRLFQEARLFVFSSWAEGFGVPPLEAMALGTPVIVTDSRGVREYALDNQNCLLVSPKSPETLAQAIRRLMGDPPLAESLRRKGLETARRFTWDLAVDRFEEALAFTSPRSGP